MDTTILEDIGLSKIEAKVFLILLEIGEAKAGKIIEKSKLQSSSVYNAINSLIDRGFVSYIKKGQVKYYKDSDPETILNYIELKKREYLKLLPQLIERQNKIDETKIEFYKLFNGIKTIISELIKDTKKGDVFRTFSLENPEEYELARKNVFSITKQLFREKKIIQRGIFHEKNRESKTKTSIMQKRYLDFPLPPNTMIMNDKIAIITWDYEPSGILIKSKALAQQYSNFFDAIWKLAKK